MHQSNTSISKAFTKKQSTLNSASIKNIVELSKLEENKVHAYEIVDKIYHEIDQVELELPIAKPKTK